jgi:peptidoglycan hydrolase-like protein with peptidoglycan-binding domain
LGSGRNTARLTGAALAALVGGGLGALGPAPASAGTAARTPVTTVAANTVAAGTVVRKAADAGCATGKYQKQVETSLTRLGGYGTITVDGKQSAADCAAIRKFQKRFGIQPAEGLAGPTTDDVSMRLANTDVASCKARKSGTTFCVDLTHQTAWIMKNGKRLTNPTVTRTGMKGYRTPAGTFTINKRTRKEWSDPYEVWLPYWQRFIGGRGFHQTTTYIHDKWRGSHGCVNLLPQDARTYWSVGKIGMTVKVFGRRPGT